MKYTIAGKEFYTKQQFTDYIRMKSDSLPENKSIIKNTMNFKKFLNQHREFLLIKK